MKLEIGKKINDPEESETRFVVHITFMHGDADKYETADWDCDDELDAMMHYEMHSLGMKFNAQGKELNDIPTKVKEEIVNRYYKQGCFILKNENLEFYASEYFCEVPGDCTCDFCRLANITKVSITFFNSSGVEFEVNIKD